jgi:hypothetical protein
MVGEAQSRSEITVPAHPEAGENNCAQIQKSSVKMFSKQKRATQKCT